MRSKVTIFLVGVAFFLTGFLVGAFYGGLAVGFLSASLLSFAAGFGIGGVTDWLGLLSGWMKGRQEDKYRKRVAWKQRMLTAYNAYVDSLASINVAAIFPVGYHVNDYGWPDVPYKLEAEAFLEKKSYYKDWKQRVQVWNDYDASYKPKNAKDVDNEFRKKLVDELMKSGIPSQNEQSVITKEYVDYDTLTTRMITLWREGDEWSYSVGRLRQTGLANHPDDKVLEKLVDIIKDLVSINLRREYTEGQNKLEKDSEILTQRRKEEWKRLVDKRDYLLANLKQLRDDIDAERETGAK